MKLKFWRQELGLTQYELSEATQIRRWKIQLFEQNIMLPNTEELKTIASVLNVTVDDLIKCENQHAS